MKHFIKLCALIGLIGCADTLSTTSDGSVKDSGWLAGDSFEVEAVIRGTAVQMDKDAWSGLAMDPALQAMLVDKQVKFVKTAAEAEGWRFNQLSDTVTITSVTRQGENVYVEYEAIIDMLTHLKGRLPALEDLDGRYFDADVPLVPESYTQDHYSNCAYSEKYTVRSYNFHYFFRPDLETCDLPLTTVSVEVTRVFERPTVYPEYDLLMQEMNDGYIGFKAALLPNRGDNDPMSRFDAHADMLENRLELSGEVMDDGLFTRYFYRKGDLQIQIDLFNPTALPWGQNFDSHFRSRLNEYDFVHYNGHSNYGNKHLLDDPEAFSNGYQIIMLHSCQSYAYYSRQVFRAKATSEDPSGFANSDIIATGKSSYPSGSPRTLEVVLRSLLRGMDAIYEGRPERAPNWLEISEGMTDSTWGDILYGIAGVRTNVWQP